MPVAARGAWRSILWFSAGKREGKPVHPPRSSWEVASGRSEWGDAVHLLRSRGFLLPADPPRWMQRHCPSQRPTIRGEYYLSPANRNLCPLSFLLRKPVVVGNRRIPPPNRSPRHADHNFQPRRAFHVDNPPTSKDYNCAISYSNTTKFNIVNVAEQNIQSAINLVNSSVSLRKATRRYRFVYTIL